MSEEWRSVPGYEGFYQVSNLGRVRSLRISKGRDRGHKDRSTPKVLKQSGCSVRNGQAAYFSICLLGKRFSVHALVLAAFVGPRPDGMEIDHIDGNGFNNSLSNLRYCTRSQNRLNQYKIVGKTSQFMGVHYNTRRKRWIAKIMVLGRTFHLGQFEQESDAANAYQDGRMRFA